MGQRPIAINSVPSLRRALEIGPLAHSWTEFAGMFKDDP
jgi:hypothetical protein